VTHAATRRRIVVDDYDPAWPRVFDELRARVWGAVADVALSVEHVGSTSVPGLAAKPIIDISIVVRERADVPLVVARLAPLGYVHRGDLGIEDRDAFDSPIDLPKHHLYACVQGGVGLQNQLAVRDYLRAHPEAAVEYGALKKRLAREFPHDIGGYVAGKTDFLLGILRAAGLPAEALLKVERANRSEATMWRKSFRTESTLAAHVEALHAFGSHRAAKVVDVLPKDCAVLLERVTPGERLASIVTEDEAMAIVARLFAEGWPKPPHGAIAEPLRTFAESLTRAAAVDREFERAAALLEKLAASSSATVLLHGDLHYDNILSSERAGYLLIDPKGAVGDPAFDVGYLVSRPMPIARGGLALAEVIDLRLKFLPDALGLEPQRVAAFAYVAAALSTAWAREDDDAALGDFMNVTRVLEAHC
jgi:GrpB-like predicted nucleotidyltransferase (UPF0157 family)/streptomycin 6-kinase